MTLGPQTMHRERWLRATALAVLCSLVALVAGTVLYDRQVKQIGRDTQRQLDLNVRLRELQQVLVAVGDAETGQRGYLLTGKAHYLVPYREAQRNLPVLLKSLDDLPLRDIRSGRQAALVRQLIGLKLAELDRTIALHAQGQREQALALVQTDLGQAYMDQARQEIAALLLAMRSERDAITVGIARQNEATRRGAIAVVSVLAASMVLATLQIALLARSRRRYGRALAASEERHRSILEEQSDLISLSQEDGTLIYVNAAYGRHFGTDPAALVGTSLFDMIEPADLSAVREHIARALAGDATLEGENRMVQAGGGEVWIAWKNRLQRGPNGERWLHSVGRDITQRKQLEMRLAERERFVREITDALPVRIAYLDRDWRFRFANLELCRGLGAPREEVIGRTRSELAGHAGEDLLRPWLERAAGGGTVSFEFAEEREGGVRLSEIQVIPDIGEAGEVRGYFSTGIDITQRKATESQLRELTLILEHTPDFVVQTDAHGRVQYLNPAVRRALGLGAGDPAQAHHFSEFNTDETNRRFATEITPTVKREGLWMGEATVKLDGRGSVLVNHMVIGHRDAQGRIGRYSAIMRDISEIVQARQALARQAATLQAVVEAVPAKVAVYDRELRHLMVNHAFERRRGLRREDVVGRSVAELFGQAEHEQVLPWAQRALAGETVNYEVERRLDGSTRHLAVTCIPMHGDDGRIQGYVEVTQDITRHRQEAQRLLDLSERDPLTGLLNRAGFQRFLDEIVDAGGAATLALLYIDLDRFKPVNDQHGHAAGDELLRQFAQRLQGLVRPTDAIARLGGDEFAVVLTQVRERGHAERIADKIVQAAQSPFVLAGGLAVGIGASVGVAHDASGDSGWSGLLEQADTGVYRAKAAGRSRRA